MSFLNAVDRSLTVAQIEDILGAQLGAREVAFCGTDGRRLPRHTTLGDVLAGGAEVVIRAVLSGAVDAGERERALAETPQVASLRAEGQAGLVVREIDRLEQMRARPFIWIGYLIKQRIPDLLGGDSRSARQLLTRLQTDGLISTSQVPNPRDPAFPATAVELNRNHPAVRRMLGASPEEVPAEETPPEQAASSTEPPTSEPQGDEPPGDDPVNGG